MLYILLFLLAFMLFVMWCCFKVGADYENNQMRTDYDNSQNCQEKNK